MATQHVPKPKLPIPWVGNGRRPRVFLVGSNDPEDRIGEAADQLSRSIAECVEVLGVNLDGHLDPRAGEADFIIVLGGDGSILRAARQMGQHQLPVLGVNLGKLGFLAHFSPEELLVSCGEVCAGRCRVVEHLMLQCRVFRNGEMLCEQIGLNEAAVLSGPPFSILEVDLYIDAELVTTYSCDGLIISTPIGSTAHSLSAGGPILRQELPAFVILAISPHTLTVRPVIDDADRVYEMVVGQPNDQTAVVVDGSPLHRLAPNDRVEVRRAATTFKMIETPEKSYYRTLREKLGWQGHLPRRNRS